MTITTFNTLRKIAEETPASTDKPGGWDGFKNTMNNWFLGDNPNTRAWSWGIGGGLLSALVANLFGASNPLLWGLLGGAGSAYMGYNYKHNTNNTNSNDKTTGVA